MSDEDDTSADATEAEVAAGVADAAGDVASVASEAAVRDAAAAIGAATGAGAAGLGLAADALGDDAKEAQEGLKTASQVVRAAGAAVQAAGQLLGAAQSGNVGGAVGSLGGVADAARYLVPEGEAQQVLAAAGAVARGLGEVVDAVEGLIEGQSHESNVQFHLEVTDADEAWNVRAVRIEEALNEISTCTVEAHYAEAIAVADLLHKECVVSIERPNHRRTFKGVVWHARVHEVDDRFQVGLTVVPAAAYLAEKTDSRIYQDQTVVDVIKAVYQDLLGDLSRTVDDGLLQRTYETREYIVQFQESHLHFISRLAEEEGIFWYFDHEADHEALVLADAVGNLPQAREDNEGKAAWSRTPEQYTGSDECVYDLEHSESVGASDAVVAGYDWTSPSVAIRGEATGRSDQTPTLERYHHAHGDAPVPHDYGGQSYSGHTGSTQARLRGERLDLDRQRWRFGANIVSAAVGKTIEVENAPVSSLDQRYLMVRMKAEGTSNQTHDIGGTWRTSIEAVPTALPYRPERRTRRPMVYGPETAVVVGPGEIHTDNHGRVRVHFHWDRHHGATAEDSSCWMRVAHHWAGPGFGTFFLPRVGMEVVVSFLGGNPDRPLITGCVYNGGENRAGVDLDGQKTQSYIRTKSSENSDGYNEIRFEDDAGSEFISVHAQKDLNEKVLNNHSTQVNANQTNTVDVDQTETVKGNQTMTVKKDRTKTVEQNETTLIKIDRTETVEGEEVIKLQKSRVTGIKENDTLFVEKERHVHVKGQEDYTVDKARVVIVKGDDTWHVQNGSDQITTVAGEYRISSDGKYQLIQGSTEKLIMDAQKTVLESAKEVHVFSRNSHLTMKNDGHIVVNGASQIAFECGSSKIELNADGTIRISGNTLELSAGASGLKLESSGTTLKGANVDMLGDMFVTIKGVLVRVN